MRAGLLLTVLAVVLASASVAGAEATVATVTVPSVTGLKSEAAKRKLVALGLRVVVHTVGSARPAGTVVAQRPGARAVVRRGAIVRLAVAAGAAPAPTTTGQTTVPDLVGAERDAADQRLEGIGLAPNVVYVHSLQLVGTVVAQDPGGGAKVDPGTRVTISISSGPGP
jgi:eukaryotic-like serine/threonine-protein kinase